MSNKKNITCIIVDDELSSQQVLHHFITKTDVLELKCICKNTSAAFKYLQLNETVDLLFLDINMPQQNGLEFYKSLKNPPAVIFTTAYPQYAVDGFEVNATDYLLKPIAYERFLAAIHKVISKTGYKKTEDKFIILKENKALHKVYFLDILYAEAYGDYVKIHLKEKTITTHSTFSGLLKRLPDFFVQTHKSFSININRLHQLAGNQIIIDSYKIPIGQTYKPQVLKALNL